MMTDGKFDIDPDVFVRIQTDLLVVGDSIIEIRRENPRVQSWNESPHGSKPLKPKRTSPYTAY